MHPDISTVAPPLALPTTAEIAPLFAVKTDVPVTVQLFTFPYPLHSLHFLSYVVPFRFSMADSHISDIMAIKKPPFPRESHKSHLSGIGTFSDLRTGCRVS